MLSPEPPETRSPDSIVWPISRNVWLALSLLILLMAAGARLIALRQVPPGLAQDEVLDADIASFIRGGEHALFFRHGYGHEPLYHYWAVPFQALLGDNLLSVRLPAAFLGLLLVALTMRQARHNYGSIAALVAGVGLAVSWWPIIFSRIGIRPIMEPVFIVIAIWSWPLAKSAISRQALLQATLAGLFLGLSVYTYTAARAMMGLPGLIVLLLVASLLVTRVRRGQPDSHYVARVRYLRTQIALALVVMVVAFIVCIPLALTLRANPDLQQRLAQLEGPLEALREGDPGPVIQATLATLGVFSFTGDPRWTYSIPDRPLFDPLTALLFYGGLLIALWRWRNPVYALLPAWLLLSLVPSALSPDAPSTVRMVGGLPVVYILPGLAVTALLKWLRGRPDQRTKKVATRPAVLSLSLLVLVAVLVFNGYRTVRDGFLQWPSELETRLRYQAALRDSALYLNELYPNETPVVVEAYFEPIDDAGLRRNAGRDPGARWVQSGAGVAGALVWPGGKSEGHIYVPEYAPLNAELAALAGVAGEPAYRSPSSPSIAVFELPAAPSHLESVIDLSLHEPADDGMVSQLTLQGIDLIALPEVGSNELRLSSTWRVDDTLPFDLRVFVHLVDESGAIRAQFDGLDAAASTLKPGDRFLQRHVLSLSNPLTPGRYAVKLGLYRQSDGVRFVTQDGRDTINVMSCYVPESTVSEAAGLSCSLP